MRVWLASLLPLFLITLEVPTMKRLKTLLKGPPKEAIELSQEFSDRLSQAYEETAHLDEFIQRHKYLVIGGNGFTGTYVARELIARGAPLVRVMSRSPPSKVRIVKGVEYVEGSMTSVADIMDALNDDVDVVFQLAAYTGNPAFGYLSEKDYNLSYSINYEGMKTVVECCRNAGIKLLVYTSSVDTVFTPEGYDNAREDQVEYKDTIKGRKASHYQRTKILAEREVLNADDPAGMRTVALRPGGIHGPQEEFALPKILAAGWYTGRHLVRFGSTNPKYSNPLLDWSFAPNIAFAHSLIVKQLHATPESINFGGKAYFITDGNSRSAANAEMFDQVLVACNISRRPIVTLPAQFLESIASFDEWLAERLSLINIHYSPALTVHEAQKATTHHTHSIESARQDFGYYPLIPHEEAWYYTAQDFESRMKKR